MPDQKLNFAHPGILDRLFQRLHISISATDITVVQSSGFMTRTEHMLHRVNLNACNPADERSVLEQLDLAVQAANCLNRNVTISFPDQFSRMWLVTPPANAATLADCRAAAALRFYALYGEFATDWEMVAHWDARRPFLASSIRRSLAQGVLAICARARLTVLRLEPHFVTVWNRFCKELGKDAWIAVLANDTLTLGAVQSGRLVALRSTALSQKILHTHTWIDQHVQREALLLNLNPPKQLQISGIVPIQWQKNDDGQIQCRPLGVLNSFVQSPAMYSEQLRQGTT